MKYGRKLPLAIGAICVLAIAILISMQLLNKNTPADTASRAEKLYSLKNDYIGDASADIALLNALGIPKIAPFTIALETTEKPYILRINFSEISTDYKSTSFYTDMKTNATILLALIGNADEIHYNNIYSENHDEIIKFKSSDVENQLGDIKSYGESLDTFESLLRKIE